MKPFGDLNCIINEGMDEIMKKFIIFVIITLIIAVIGCGFYIWYNNIPSSEILGDSIYFNATTFTYEGSDISDAEKISDSANIEIKAEEK